MRYTAILLLVPAILFTACSKPAEETSNVHVNPVEQAEQRRAAERRIIRSYLSESDTDEVIRRLRRIKYDNPDQMQADTDAVFQDYVNEDELEALNAELAELQHQYLIELQR